MARRHSTSDSLRFSRPEINRLLLALVISLLAHVAVWGGWLAGKKAGLWDKLHWPVRHPVAAQPLKPAAAARTEPQIYLDVAAADTEAPKQAKYYSDKNSRAANPDVDANTSQPKLNGKQRDVPKTEDAPRPQKNKSATPVPPEKTTAQKPAEPKPSGLAPGNTQAGKPSDNAAAEPPPKPRPRTIREALAQQDKPPGLQLQQDGGVSRRALASSLDAMATPFGDYDRRIVDAIRTRWYDLLDSQKFAMDRTGKVTVTFHLNPDGSVTEARINGNTVGDLLGYVCQAAIEQAAPFGAWSPEMRRLIGTNFREITFTFYYY
jgi:outer membrane biosynthesis protein TonB